jgi:hypothetical protein
MISQEDRKKLVEAGFTVIRADYNEMVIKQSTKQSFEWHVKHKAIRTNSEMDLKLKELLKSSITIIDK